MTIRVCHILAGDIWGGAEAVTFNLLQAIQQHKEFHSSVVLFNRGRLWQCLREESIPVFVIDEQRNNNLQMWLKLMKYLRVSNFDIVHTHGYKANIMSSLIRKIIGGTKVIRTEHGIVGKGSDNKRSIIMSYIDKYIAIAFNDKIITVSRQIKREKYSHLGSSKTVVVHNGIVLKQNQEFYNDVRQELKIDSSKKVIGLIGRLVPVKGVDIFLEIGQMISCKDTFAQFIVIGDGPLKIQLEQKAKSLGIKHKIIFTGFKEHISPYLSVLDLLAITSRHEGIPLVLLESFCHRVPVVAFDVGGISEVIKDGESGLLVQPGDRQAFAGKVLHLLHNKTEYTKIQNGGYQRVMANFTIDSMAKKTMDIYREICEQ